MLPWKYEFTREEVEYLRGMLNLLPLKGENQAKSMLQMMNHLSSPLNSEELNEEHKKEEEETKK